MLKEAKKLSEDIEIKTQSFYLANDLENSVVQMGHSLPYDHIVETCILIAEVTQENIAMYVGKAKLNPKWNLWNEVIKQLKTRLN